MPARPAGSGEVVHHPQWSTPAASASAAIERKCSASRSRPPGQSKLDRCRPTLTPRAWRTIWGGRDQAAVAGRQRRRHDHDRLRRDAAHPMARRGRLRRVSPATGAADCRRHRQARRPVAQRCADGIPLPACRTRPRRTALRRSGRVRLHRARASASRPRESITVVNRRRRRPVDDVVEQCEASAEARRSCSFSPTTARSASLDTTWPRAKCSAAQVDLPDATGPISTTSDGDGSCMGSPMGEAIRLRNRRWRLRRGRARGRLRDATGRCSTGSRHRGRCG